MAHQVTIVQLVIIVIIQKSLKRQKEVFFYMAVSQNAVDLLIPSAMTVLDFR